MPYDSNKHHRHSIRLKGYDYTSMGWYFVTMCTKNREEQLGIIKYSKMELNKFGLIVESCWRDLVKHYHNIKLDEYIIMPNHFHGIIYIDKNRKNVDGADVVGAGFKPAPTGLDDVRNDTSKRINHGLPEIIRAFKTFSSRQINVLRKTQGIPFWQRNYYERIIRNNRELNAIQIYIRNNPIKWYFDSKDKNIRK